MNLEKWGSNLRMTVRHPLPQPNARSTYLCDTGRDLGNELYSICLGNCPTDLLLSIGRSDS